MSSIVVEEARVASHKKRVATSKMEKNKSRVSKVIENEIRTYFLICESCTWCATYCENLYYDYYDYENLSGSQNMLTKYPSCPTCSTNEGGVELFQISFDNSGKASIGVNFH
jgi:hypothetical protein